MPGFGRTARGCFFGPNRRSGQAAIQDMNIAICGFGEAESKKLTKWLGDTHKTKVFPDPLDVFAELSGSTFEAVICLASSKKMAGRDLARIIRLNPEKSGMPILLMEDGSPDMKDEVTIGLWGVTHILRPPFTRETVNAGVDALRAS
jgi:DNA-binding response OmpR family regulator